MTRKTIQKKVEGILSVASTNKMKPSDKYVINEIMKAFENQEKSLRKKYEAKDNGAVVSSFNGFHTHPVKLAIYDAYMKGVNSDKMSQVKQIEKANNVTNSIMSSLHKKHETNSVL